MSIRRRTFSGLAAVVVAVAGLGSASPAFAQDTLTLTVNSISRDEPGHFVFSTSVVASASVNQTGGLCAGSFVYCTLTIEAQTAAGVSQIYSYSKFDNVLSGSQSDSVRAGLTLTSAVTEVRARLVRDSTNFLATSWQPVVDPGVAEVAISLDAFTISRDQEGELTYDVTASATPAIERAGELCYSPRDCTMLIEVQTSGGVATIASRGTFENLNPLSAHLTGQVTSGVSLTQEVTAIRARLQSSSTDFLATSWQPVVDPGVAEVAVSLDALSIGRNEQGKLTYDMTISATPAIERSGELCAALFVDCMLSLQVQTAEGVVSIWSMSHFEDRNPLQVVWDGVVSSGVTLQESISAVRARLSNGSSEIVTEWQTVEDIGPMPPEVWLTVNDVVRTANQVAINLRATASGSVEQQGQPCYSTCTLYIQALSSDGVDYRDLVVVSNFQSRPDSTFAVDSTFNLDGVLSGGVSALRLKLVNSGSTSVIESNWLQVSENISDGHDLDASIEMALVAVAAMSPVSACVTLFPVGTHAGGSSVNDQQLACLSATQGGQSVRSFLTGYIASMSRSQVTQMLVRAGIQMSSDTAALSLDLDYGQQLPPGCSWTGLTQITCTDESGTTSTHVPVSAPPQQDPIWESNSASESAQDRAEGQQAPPILAPDVVAGPLAGATQRDIDVFVRRQCEEYVAVWGASAQLDDDACDTMPIFVTGGDVLEASKHDLVAITSHPEWLALQMVKASGPSQEKLVSRPTWEAPPCGPLPRPDGQQCDEFPFFATEQGYPTVEIPDLALIDSTHNTSQGGRLSAFTRSCSKIWNSTRGSFDRWYLVIPIPLVDKDKHPIVTTFGICPS